MLIKLDVYYFTKLNLNESENKTKNSFSIRNPYYLCLK